MATELQRQGRKAQRSGAHGMDGKKKRLLILILFGVAAVAATLLLTESSVPAPQPVTKAPSQGAPAAGQPGASAPIAAASVPGSPVMPKGAAGNGQTMRDIFSPPAGYVAPLPGTGTTAGGPGGPAFSAAGMPPVLTGVIMGDSTRVAILRQGTISRSYRIGESAGSYQVVAIDARSVTLEGPSGTINLTMGK